MLMYTVPKAAEAVASSFTIVVAVKPTNYPALAVSVIYDFISAVFKVWSQLGVHDLDK